jgi:hypothetical protein
MNEPVAWLRRSGRRVQALAYARSDVTIDAADFLIPGWIGGEQHGDVVVLRKDSGVAATRPPRRYLSL